MLRNYLLITLRQFRKQRMYAAIKIGGFALSIAACILITLYILDERSYDRHYAHPDRTFRVINVDKTPNSGGQFSDFPAGMASALKADFPQVERAGRLLANTYFYPVGNDELRRADQTRNTHEEGFAYADQDLLDVLGLPMVYGEPGHALDKPRSIVLTRRKAEKYFPHQNPVGQLLYMNNDQERPFTVGGVIEDFGSSSSLQFDFLMSLKGMEFWPGEQANWSDYNYETYVQLRPGANPETFRAAADAEEKRKHFIPAMLGYGEKDAEQKAKLISISLQPVSDIYLKSYDIHDDLPSHGDIRLVWMFGGIALFILVIACINFVNLSTAKSANRAKEVGLRKVIGSQRSGLIAQFLAESMVYSLLAVALALLIAGFLLPFFNTLTAKNLSLPWTTWWFGPGMLMAVLIVGVLAGLYPAVYLSAFKPAKVLKGAVATGSRNASLRSILVVFQFTTSIILIIGTVVIYRQMQYILHKKVGFDKEQVLVLQGTNAIGDQNAFKNDILRLPQVRSVSVSDFLPVQLPDSKYDNRSFYIYSQRSTSAPAFAQSWLVDYDYLPTLGLHLQAGRNFSRSMASDTAAAVINQAMAQKLGLGSHPLGSIITDGGAPLRVIGVIGDFNFYSFRDQIEPLCLRLGYSPSMISVKFNTARIDDLIPGINALWNKYVPNQALRYTFLDDGFKHMYTDVRRAGSLLTCFTLLAIVIACLGLFALSSFMVEQRTKEIGIRKVLGASIGQILVLLSRDFVRLIVISLLIASPIAWWAAHAWLQDFVYRQEVSAWIFFAVAAITLAIALMTTGFQSVKTALDNPIKSLRTE